MPLFPLFWSKLFILLGLGTLSPVYLFVMLVLLFLAAAALGYFVLTTFTKISDPARIPDIVQYHTPVSMKLPILFLLGLLVVTGLFFTQGEVIFISSIVTELRF
jgi:formate hydrogenlyase subunit 3/multisubunit Na+/H+ antiporter MnhD subunit